MSLRDKGLGQVLATEIEKKPKDVTMVTRQLTADLVRLVMEGAEKQLALEEVYAQIDLRHAKFYEDLKPFLKESAP